MHLSNGRAAFTLLPGLGAVSILVDGTGVANRMVIAVLENGTEIGFRRLLGVTRLHIASYFLVKTWLMGAIVSTGGIILGNATMAK